MKAKFGRYIFLKKLAVGGMAEIYLARRVSFGGFAKFVVIKRLLPEHKGRAAYERLFLAEARTGALLNHPNIAGLHDLGKLDDHYFMAMEFVDGVSVAEVMARAAKARRPVPLGAALRICFGVADALHYAHHTLDEHGEPLRILHHDITPQNVQLSFEGDVKLLDFGVSTRMGRPVAGGRRGKPGYMSPEALRKEPLDARSDLYSLGVVLYELTTGRRVGKPQDNSLPTELEAPPAIVPPTKLDPYFPPSLEELVLPALAADVAARPADAQVFSRALRETGRKLGFDTSAEALAAYLKELMGPEIEAHRAELAELARKSDPVRRVDRPAGGAEGAASSPGADAVAPAATPAPAAGAGPASPGATGAAGASILAGGSGLPVALPDGLPPEEALAPQLSGEFDAQVFEDPVGDAAADALPDALDPPPVAPAPPAPPTRSGPSALARAALVAGLLLGGVVAGRFWGEQAARAQDAAFGSLEVETVPPGARVYDGERLLGISTFRDARIPVGAALDLRIVLDGYKEWRGAAELGPDRRHRSLTISLEPAR